MNQPKLSWIARLFNGAELARVVEAAKQHESDRAESKAMLDDLKARLAGVEAELKVRTDIMNVTSIVSEADKKGDIVSINDKFAEVSKYSRDELIGKPHNTTRHPDMPKEPFKQLWSTIGRGDVFRGIIKNRAKDGTPYYVDAVVAPILGENGKPMKYLGVRYDITAAEIERQNARGILGAIDASYAYIEFDLSGNVLKANANFLQLLGQHQTVIKPLGRMFRSLRGMSGSSILGNGEVALIFDVSSLSQLAAEPPGSTSRVPRSKTEPASHAYNAHNAPTGRTATSEQGLTT